MNDDLDGNIVVTFTEPACNEVLSDWSLQINFGSWSTLGGWTRLDYYRATAPIPDSAVGLPWRLLSDNGGILWVPGYDLEVPESGIVGSD